MTKVAPIVSFYRLIAQAREPERADRAALGTLPTRAFRYCEAVTSAAGYGWWVFPPMELQLLFDGNDIFWHFDGVPDWLPLSPAAQFPDFSDAFDAAAPAELAGCAPPFLTALREPGVVQIWTGLMARSLAGWSLLVRAPANLPLQGGYAQYEGIVESDRWFGPLFTNLRLTQTNRPLRLRPDVPLLQVQPVPRFAYADDTLNAMTIQPDMAHMAEQDWAAYRDTIVIPNDDPDRPFGSYAVAARKRRKRACPVSPHPGQEPDAADA